MSDPKDIRVMDSYTMRLEVTYVVEDSFAEDVARGTAEQFLRDRLSSGIRSGLDPVAVVLTTHKEKL